MKITNPLTQPRKWRVSIIAVLFLLYGALLTAQQPQQKVSFSGQQISIGKMMQEMQRQTNITFAFDSRTFDSSRIIKLESRPYSVEEAVTRMTADMGYSYLIKDGYVVINSTPKQTTPGAKNVMIQQPRTGDQYTRTNPSNSAGTTIARTANETLTNRETPTLNYPAPYSAYTDPDLYSQIQNRLPVLAVKTNLLYGAAALTPNLAGEIGLGLKTTLETGGSWNRFNRTGTLDDNKKLNHWIIRPEFRYWFCERFNGHFLGLHTFYSQYNISQYDIPMLFEKEYRYEGSAFGGGITYGYHLPISKQWGIEFHAGIGVAQLKYKRFDCTLCSDIIDEPTKTYFGPTRGGINLVFMIK